MPSIAPLTVDGIFGRISKAIRIMREKEKIDLLEMFKTIINSREYRKSLGAFLGAGCPTDWNLWQTIINEVTSLGGDVSSLARILANAKFRRELANMIVYKTKHLWKSITSVSGYGLEWIVRFQDKGLRCDHSTLVKIFCDEKIITSDGVGYDLVVIKGNEFDLDDSRTSENVRRFAKSRGYLTPPFEVAILLRDSTMDNEIEKMGLTRLVVFHEPIDYGNGGHNLLSLDTDAAGGWLRALESDPRWWPVCTGFVFLAPSVSQMDA